MYQDCYKKDEIVFLAFRICSSSLPYSFGYLKNEHDARGEMFLSFGFLFGVKDETDRSIDRFDFEQIHRLLCSKVMSYPSYIRCEEINDIDIK